MKIKNILVPVDFSEFSDRAVNYARFLAKHYQAKITLLHAITLFHAEPGQEKQLEEYEQWIAEREKEVRASFSKHNADGKQQGVEIDGYVVRSFSAADTILDYIADNDVDIVVIGTHGRTGFKKFVYGSVAEKIVRLSPIPVITLHRAPEPPAIRRILVPVDFSDYAKTAVEKARDIAQKFKADLTFLHVIEQSLHPAFYAADIASIFQVDPGLKNRILERMAAFTGISPEQAGFAVSEGKAHKEIKKYAEMHEIDLIVMATRGLSGLEQFLIGSNAERVVSIAPCPVLTVGRGSH